MFIYMDISFPKMITKTGKMCLFAKLTNMIYIKYGYFSDLESEHSGTGSEDNKIEGHVDTKNDSGSSGCLKDGDRKSTSDILGFPGYILF